ncbi:MAG: ParB/RepB/Spo0J family partition protein [Candidatus Thiodiazotropha sp.]
MSLEKQNLVTRAIEIVGISKLTKACGLASRNAIKTWEKSGRIPIDAETDYPGIIERATSGQITRVDIWRGQIDTLKPGVVYRIPISLLNRDQNQPRRVFDTYSLQDLALSLGKDGQETPIKFIVIDGQLVIKHGERRWRAAHVGKIETLDGVLDVQENETSHERIFRQIADNTGEPLKPWDWVETFQQFHDDGLSDQNIADELASRGIKGFSRPVIANYRRLLKLPVEIQEMIKSEFLTPSHGKEILVHAKHKVILRNLAMALNKMVEDDENPPPSGCMVVEIRDLYEQAFPYVDGNLNGELDDEKFPYSCSFDYETECKDCKNVHTSKLSNGHEDKFCTKPACYLEKCETVKEEIEETGIDQTPAGSDDLTAPGASTATKSIVPESDDNTPNSIKRDVKSILEKQAQQKNYKERVSEAIQSASSDEIDSILVYSYSLDSDAKIDGEEPTIQAISRRIQVDATGMKRIAAINAIGYLLDNDIQAIGNFLGVSLEEKNTGSSDENLQLEV